jgi:hypothetical protein
MFGPTLWLGRNRPGSASRRFESLSFLGDGPRGSLRLRTRGLLRVSGSWAYPYEQRSSARSANDDPIAHLGVARFWTRGVRPIASCVWPRGRSPPAVDLLRPLRRTSAATPRHGRPTTTRLGMRSRRSVWSRISLWPCGTAGRGRSAARRHSPGDNPTRSLAEN